MTVFKLIIKCVMYLNTFKKIFSLFMGIHYGLDLQLKRTLALDNH